MKFLATTARLLGLVAAVTSLAAAPSIIINEIHYHPANDDDRLQYIELHNPTSAEVDLSGWKLRGAKFDFPQNVKIPPAGFLVVARDLRALQGNYGTEISAIGNLGGRLKRGGEKIELVDKSDQIIETLKFSDQPPWPLGPDGFATTLERISPAAPADDPYNWAPSKRASRKGREGTPGRPNDSASAKPLPIVENVKWEKLPAPGKPITVSATIRAAKDVEKASLLVHTFQLGSRTGTTNQYELKRSSGDALKGEYEAIVPAQQSNTLVRFVVKATADGVERSFPARYEPRPALSSYVFTPPKTGRLPQATILNPVRLRSGSDKFQPPREDLPQVGNSAFVYVSPDGKAELHDFVEVRNRSGGWKVQFLKDQRLEGMGTINLISEGPSRWMLAEHLSYELFRRAGMNIQNSGHYRLNIDGREGGYILFVEQPNKTYLARSGRNNQGNLYKIRWFEQDPVAAHEKKTNRTQGHEDVTSTIQNLRKLKGEAQWAYIQENFNVTNFINYYAVNMCVQNWDGFFNNYYVYRDTKPGGKWEIIPWDEDKTWGEYDGASGNYDWYEMPLTSGMIGDRPVRTGGGSGPFGGAGWWRPGGWFSGPLLANPQFRKAFLTRLHEICQTTFTEEKFGPVIQDLGAKLRSEIQLVSNSSRRNAATAELDRNIKTFENQLTYRRHFILKELAKEGIK